MQKAQGLCPVQLSMTTANVAFAQRKCPHLTLAPFCSQASLAPTVEDWEEGVAQLAAGEDAELLHRHQGEEQLQQQQQQQQDVSP